jgi:hypothetical protein
MYVIKILREWVVQCEIAMLRYGAALCPFATLSTKKHQKLLQALEATAALRH